MDFRILGVPYFGILRTWVLLTYYLGYYMLVPYSRKLPNLRAPGRRLRRQPGIRPTTRPGEILGLGVEDFRFNVGALVITNTVLGGPYYSYSIMGPKTLF